MPAVPPANLELEWTSQAGATYPSAASVQFTSATDLPPSPALLAAAEACRRAITAAVQHAAATTALERVDTELASTVHRLRAIRDRWLPRIKTQLDALDLRLDETEREEHTRLRRATSTTGGVTRVSE
jgi:vacuolar-type H+-ATPase subunit D/Vma8